MVVTQVLLGNGFKQVFMLLVTGLPFFLSLGISRVVLGIKGRLTVP